MKKIYILGSGSSIGHSEKKFPAINEFFVKANSIGYFSKEIYSDLINYIVHIYGHEIDANPYLDIEALFTHLEIDIENDNNPLLIRIKDKLLFLIRQTLMKLHDEIKDKDGEYDYLIKLLNSNDTVITYNWDILLDNKLGRKENLYRRFNEHKLSQSEAKEINLKIDSFPLQYKRFINRLSAIHEQTWEGISVKMPYKEWDDTEGHFLKLHGSIDWFYCKNENCRAYNMVFPVEIPIAPYFCSECHEQLENLLIPPILKKEFRKYPLIRRLWNVAIREIKEAEEIIFWGYSLPPTDFYSDWLFRKIPKYKKEPVLRINKIVIINPAAYIDNTINKEFINKFYNIFQRKISPDKIISFRNFTEYKNSFK